MLSFHFSGDRLTLLEASLGFPSVKYNSPRLLLLPSFHRHAALWFPDEFLTPTAEADTVMSQGPWPCLQEALKQDRGANLGFRVTLLA